MSIYQTRLLKDPKALETVFFIGDSFSDVIKAIETEVLGKAGYVCIHDIKQISGDADVVLLTEDDTSAEQYTIHASQMAKAFAEGWVVAVGTNRNVDGEPILATEFVKELMGVQPMLSLDLLSWESAFVMAFGYWVDRCDIGEPLVEKLDITSFTKGVIQIAIASTKIMMEDRPREEDF